MRATIHINIACPLIIKSPHCGHFKNMPKPKTQENPIRNGLAFLKLLMIFASAQGHLLDPVHGAGRLVTINDIARINVNMEYMNTVLLKLKYPRPVNNAQKRRNVCKNITRLEN